jgi:hypothetical protein
MARAEKTPALEKRAGEAGNRHGFDLDVTPRKLNRGRAMNLNPAEWLNPIFNTLDGLIENDGVYLYLMFVWLSLGAIAWVLSGGLQWRRSQESSVTIISGVIIMMRPPNQSPPPITINDVELGQNHDNETLDEP